ncbi:PaaI family thioesterase [Qaidamihabitans albus]|uniref:PaaI family thioesterase n=1 Tax=Qaidamihabitans albus TaxID=2795733 RepID=UPI0018F1A462|nr:PaaI family thioesterase [Qaidamihabitans albus]
MTAPTVPAGFAPLQQTGFLGHLDGIWTRRQDAGLDTCLIVAPTHLNPNGTVHGGVLLALLDFTLGGTVEEVLAVDKGTRIGQGDRHPATITLTTQFTAAAGSDDLLLGRAWVQRRTRAITFVAGELTSADKVVATASAVFKHPPSA